MERETTTPGHDIDINGLLTLAVPAAEEGCHEILNVYNSADFGEEKKADASPLTRADRNAHRRIASVLQPAGLPILSEEGRDVPYAERKNWDYFWMVDPLDGTKEFIKRNGEFTVNIALIRAGAPILGVVSVPVSGETYYSTRGNGAYIRVEGKEQKLPRRPRVDLKAEGLRVVASRSHMNDETNQFIQSLRDPLLVSAGSSLKFMLLASGK